jgi:Fic family protein
MIQNSKGLTRNASDLMDFMRESNAIEEVYDDDSLTQGLLAWSNLERESVLSIPSILTTHKILMLNQHIHPDEKGYFRKVPVYIGGKEATPASKLPNLMIQWVEITNYNTKCKNLDSWKMAHVTFERIHPFIDGNGRMGRLILNWQRQKMGLPILVIKESERFEYYKWFR